MSSIGQLPVRSFDDPPNGLVVGLRLTLFGVARIGQPGKPPLSSGLWRHSLALLAILAEAGERPVSRERLTSLLWPDIDTLRARNRLKQIQFALQRTLGKNILESHGAGLRLNRAEVSCDLWDFEAAVTTGDASAAVAVYVGPFLDGFYIPGSGELELWIDRQRMRVARSYRTACETLGTTAMDAGEPAEAVGFWRKSLAADPLCSRAALGLMQSLAASGDRNGALEFALAYQDQVREELQAPPDAAMCSFIARLTAPNGSEPGPVVRQVVEPITEAASDPPVAGRRGTVFAWRWAGGMAGAIGLALALAYRHLTPSVPAEIRTTAVAVLPFTVSGPRHSGGEYLGGAFMQLLTADLDSLGALRAIPADLVQRAARSWVREGALTGERPRVLATRLGAGLYVVGRVFVSGGRLRVTATMHSAEGKGFGEPVSVGTVEGEEAQLFDLVDRLTAQLIAGRYRAEADRSVRSAALSTASLPSLKAYLEGEELYRRDRHASALDAFRRAAAADSTFALSHYGMARAADMLGQLGPALVAARRASELRDNLPGRERNIVQAFYAALAGNTEEAEAQYREILADHPEDGEAWWRLGELLMFRDPLRGRPPTGARAALARAVALDSTNLDALVALARLTSFDRPVEHAVLRRRLEAWVPQAPAAAMRAFRTFVLADRPSLKSVTRMLLADLGDIQPNVVLRGTLSIDDVDAVEEMARSMAQPDRPWDVRAYGHRMLSQAALARGQWRQGLDRARVVHQFDQAQGHELMGTIAALPFLDLPRSELLEIRRGLESWRPDSGPEERPHTTAHLGLHQVIRLYNLGVVNARLGEPKEALRLASLLERGTETERTHLSVTLAYSIRARVAFQRGQQEKALRLLEMADWEAVADLTVAEAADRYLRAELLRATGRSDEALSWYAGLGLRATYEMVYLAPAALHMAAIYDGLGHLRTADRFYERYKRLRDAAE